MAADPLTATASKPVLSSPNAGQCVLPRLPVQTPSRAGGVHCPALPSRAATARGRALAARAALADCHLCAHHCGVNRLAGEQGRCHAGAAARVFSTQVEVGDELELIPTFAIALSGCDLRCDFCLTGAQSWNPGAGEPLRPQVLGRRAAAALAGGARTVMILGGEPTIHLPTVLEIVAAMPDTAKLVWKTNAHGSEQARVLLDGLFDACLADYKFGNASCSERLAGVRNYGPIVQENLLWASQRGELIVRHLLMPGHLDCCWGPVAEWLAEELPEVKVSLRSAFWPAWHADRHLELRQTVSRSESMRAVELARSLGLNLIP
jgi:putative pyruvate formate lyase activating enzyme